MSATTATCAPHFPPQSLEAAIGNWLARQFPIQLLNFIMQSSFWQLSTPNTKPCQAKLKDMLGWRKQNPLAYRRCTIKSNTYQKKYPPRTPSLQCWLFMRGSLGGQNNRTLYRVTLAIQHCIGGRGEEGIAFIASEVFDFLSIYCGLSKFLILTQSHTPEKLRRKHRHNRKAHANGHTHIHAFPYARSLARWRTQVTRISATSSTKCQCHAITVYKLLWVPTNRSTNRLQTVVNCLQTVKTVLEVRRASEGLNL